MTDDFNWDTAREWVETGVEVYESGRELFEGGGGSTTTSSPTSMGPAPAPAPTRAAKVDPYGDVIVAVIANAKFGTGLPSREQVQRAIAWKLGSWTAWAKDVLAYSPVLAEHRRALAKYNNAQLYVGVANNSPLNNPDDQANMAYVRDRLGAMGLPMTAAQIAQVLRTNALWIKAMEKIFGPQTLVARRPVAAAPMQFAAAPVAPKKGPGVGTVVAVGGLGALAWLLFL